MAIIDYNKYNLHLFDGAAGGSGASSGGDGGTASAGGTGLNTQEGDSTKNSNVYTPRSKRSGAYDNVKYGKQATAESSAEKDVDVPAAEGEKKAEESTPEQREKAYRDFIEAHKDLYTKDTQKIINQRFKETKQLQDSNAKQKAVIDQIAKRYGLDGSDLAALQTALDNDNDYWSRAAEDAGFDDVDMFKNFKKLERENAEFHAREERARAEEEAAKKVQQAKDQVTRWNAQVEEVKAKYPDFDIDKESKDKNFMSMLKSGVPMEHAYKVLHHDDIVKNAVSKAEAEREKKVVDNIRAKGARPAENGLSRASGFTVKSNVHELNKADRAEIARKAARGEYIEF